MSFDTLQSPLSLVMVVLLSVQAITTQVQCEFNVSSWKIGEHFFLSERQMLVSTIYDGVDVIVDSQDGFVSQFIRNSGNWQPRNLRTMARFVKQGSRILNIGSHIGLQAIVLGKIVGQTGRLHIFEPYSLTYNMVLKNIYLNGLQNISSVYNVGASNKKVRGDINVNRENTGGSQIFIDKSVGHPKGQMFEVKLDLVDSVLPKEAVIDFALIDVERLQVECLQGMKETIERSPNMVIMCEWSGHSNNSANIKQKMKELLNWLIALKFKFYQISKQKGETCILQLFTELQMFQVLNIIQIQDIFIVPGNIDPNAAQ